MEHLNVEEVFRPAHCVVIKDQWGKRIEVSIDEAYLLITLLERIVQRA